MLNTPCKLCGATMASLNSPRADTSSSARAGMQGHALGGFGDIDQMIGLVNRMMKHASRLKTEPGWKRPGDTTSRHMHYVGQEDA